MFNPFASVQALFDGTKVIHSYESLYENPPDVPNGFLELIPTSEMLLGTTVVVVSGFASNSELTWEDANLFPKAFYLARSKVTVQGVPGTRYSLLQDGYKKAGVFCPHHQLSHTETDWDLDLPDEIFLPSSSTYRVLALTGECVLEVVASDTTNPTYRAIMVEVKKLTGVSLNAKGFDQQLWACRNIKDPPSTYLVLMSPDQLNRQNALGPSAVGPSMTTAETNQASKISKMVAIARLFNMDYATLRQIFGPELDLHHPTAHTTCMNRIGSPYNEMICWSKHNFLNLLQWNVSEFLTPESAGDSAVAGKFTAFNLQTVCGKNAVEEGATPSKVDSTDRSFIIVPFKSLAGMHKSLQDLVYSLNMLVHRESAPFGSGDKQLITEQFAPLLRLLSNVSPHSFGAKTTAPILLPHIHRVLIKFGEVLRDSASPTWAPQVYLQKSLIALRLDQVAITAEFGGKEKPQLQYSNKVSLAEKAAAAAAEKKKGAGGGGGQGGPANKKPKLNNNVNINPNNNNNNPPGGNAGGGGNGGGGGGANAVPVADQVCVNNFAHAIGQGNDCNKGNKCDRNHNFNRPGANGKWDKGVLDMALDGVNRIGRDKPELKKKLVAAINALPR